MGHESGWAPPTNFIELQRDMNRRLDQLQRRNRTPRASDIMGPGLAARARRVLDWHATETSFNGLFYSQPGALNSPDPDVAWIGQSIATALGSGTLIVRELAGQDYDGSSPRRFAQAFRTMPDTTRQFGDWEDETGGGDTAEWVAFTPDTSGTDLGSGGEGHGFYMLKDGMVDFVARLTLGTGFSIGSPTLEIFIPDLPGIDSSTSAVWPITFMWRGAADMQGQAKVAGGRIQAYRIGTGFGVVGLYEPWITSNFVAGDQLHFGGRYGLSPISAGAPPDPEDPEDPEDPGGGP